MNKAIAVVFALVMSGAALADLPAVKCGLKDKHTVCIEGPETRVINGAPIYRACWKERTDYVCIQPGIKNTCGSAISRGASKTGSWCKQGVNIDGAYHCITEEHEYESTLTPATSSTANSCAAQTYCLDGKCFDTGNTPDPDFVKAVTGMETVRQAGAYMDDAGVTLFKGNDQRCSKSVLKNCCTASGGGVGDLTNLALMGGSAYLYDVLGGPRAIVFGFDPTSFAISIAVMVIQQMLACEPEEALVAVKRDKRLCIYVGDYCSKQLNLLFIKICIQHKETYCCFNSKLARIINEGYRAQSGSGWGSAQSPSCGGLTVTQFQTLDFAAIDFSEFYADIKPDMNANSTATTDVTKKVKCYFQNDPTCK